MLKEEHEFSQGVHRFMILCGNLANCCENHSYHSWNVHYAVGSVLGFFKETIRLGKDKVCVANNGSHAISVGIEV